MELCKRNTALTGEEFIQLFESLQSVHSFFNIRRTAIAALYMYLMKMRTRLPAEDIGNLFNVTKTTVGRLISRMRLILKQDFVPQLVNCVRSREELISHKTVMSNTLFDPEGKKIVMLVCDAT